MIHRRLIGSVFVLGIILSAAPRVRGAEPAEQTMRSTVRVFSGVASGTGFLVQTGEPADAGKRLMLVTAAHVFDEMASDRCTIVFRSLSPAKVYERKPVEVPMRGPKGPLWVRHPEVDLAVMPVDVPADIDVQPYDLNQIAEASLAEEGKLMAGQDAFIPCFPVQLEANAAGFPVLRRGSIATFPLFPLASAKTILIDYSNFKGDSGAPVVVWREGKPIVIGLVSAMHRQTERTVTPSEERTVHSPLGLAIVVQAPYIRLAIDEWKKSAAVTR